MKLVMFLVKLSKKETKAIVLMYFLPEVLFKKIKIALRIAFYMNCKKKITTTAYRQNGADFETC